MKRDAGSYFEAAKMVENLLDGVEGAKNHVKYVVGGLKSVTPLSMQKSFGRKMLQDVVREK